MVDLSKYSTLTLAIAGSVDSLLDKALAGDNKGLKRCKLSTIYKSQNSFQMAWNVHSVRH